MNGAKCLRVLSAKRPVTHDRAAAERELDLELVGAHATQQSAALASAGAYETAMFNARRWSNLLRRNVGADAERQEQFSAWAQDMGGLDRHIQEAVIKEAEEEEEEDESGDDLFSAASARQYGELASVGHHQQEEQEDAVAAAAAPTGLPVQGGGGASFRFPSNPRGRTVASRNEGSAPAIFAVVSARRKTARSSADHVAAEIRSHINRGMKSRARRTPK